MKSPKPPVLSPKPNPEQLVKRFSFNRKPNEPATTATTSSSVTSSAPVSSGPEEIVKKIQNGSSSESIVARKFQPRESVVTSTPVANSGPSMVRRISAEYNSKLVSDDKTASSVVATPPRSKSWQPTQTLPGVGEEVKVTPENSFKSSTFVASLLTSDQKPAEHSSFRLGNNFKKFCFRKILPKSFTALPQRSFIIDISYLRRFILNIC